MLWVLGNSARKFSFLNYISKRLRELDKDLPFMKTKLDLNKPVMKGAMKLEKFLKSPTKSDRIDVSLSMPVATIVTFMHFG